MRLAEFERAVETHRNRVFTLAFYLLGKREDAEEILQEVLLRLWRHRSRLERRRLGAWLLTVTRNACYDHLRRRSSAGRDTIVAIDNAALERAAGPEPDPERRTASAELRARVLAELARMPEPFKSVLILREIQELKYREIADILELPLNSVRVYLHRGRRRLRQRLREALEV